MLDFLLASPNLAFTIVLGLLLVIFAFELTSLLFGADLSGVLGDIDLPDLDLPDADLDVEVLDPGIVTKFLYWLRIGRVPLLVLLVIFMALFVICGYALQYVCLLLLGRLAPGWLAAPAALLLAIPAARVCARPLSKLIPGDETDAINRRDLVGLRAVIVLGKAGKGSPAQARTRDRHGTTHYFMVEPDNPEETLESGRDLLLVRNSGNLFYAIVHPDPSAPDNA